MIALNSSSGASRFARTGANRQLQAVVDVIVDQRPLGVDDRLLNRVQLLSQVHAGPALLDHLHDAAQMAFRPLEPIDDLRVGRVQHWENHIPLDRICQRRGSSLRLISRSRCHGSGLFGRSHLLKLDQQQDVINRLDGPADDERPAEARERQQIA